MKQHVFFKRGSNPLALLAKICMVALGVGLSACGGESKRWIGQSYPRQKRKS